MDDFIDMKLQFFLLGIEPRFIGCPAVEDVSTNKTSAKKDDNPLENEFIIYNNLPTNKATYQIKHVYNLAT